VPPPIGDPRHPLNPALWKTAAKGILFPAAQLQTFSPRTKLSADLKRTVPMEMNGKFRIPAPRQRVWEGLNDPEVLKQCIPGCQSLEKMSDTEFNGRVIASVGPVRATFGGKVKLSDLDPPRSYTLSFDGQGGGAGFAKGTAKVALAPVENGAATSLSYTVNAQVGGKIAQIGSRLVDGAAQKLADDFFGRFSDAVAAKVGAVPVAAAVRRMERAAAPRRRWIRIIALALIALLIAYLFARMRR